MNRYLAGLITGALAAAGAIMLDTRRLSLLVLVVALAAGLVAGALVGWRAPQPRAALFSGALTGAMAGALFLLADLAGGAAAAPRPAALAIISLIACVIVGASCAGIVSAWTGYPHSAEAAPQRAGASGPLGPMPEPA